MPAIGPGEDFQNRNSRELGNFFFNFGAHFNHHGGGECIAESGDIHHDRHIRWPHDDAGAGFNAAEGDQIDFVRMLHAGKLKM